MRLEPGTRFDRYQILSQIGRGGMGEVYLAQDSRLGRKVALKLLPAQYTQDAERLRRFEQEALTASALNHPNIVTIYEVGEAEGRPFIATEYIEGTTLRRRMAAGRLTMPETLEIASQVVSALAAAHAAGIVHRDVKPENIMIRPDGYVKVLDFGLAKLTERSSGVDGLPAGFDTGENQAITTDDASRESQTHETSEHPLPPNAAGGASSSELVPPSALAATNATTGSPSMASRASTAAPTFFPSQEIVVMGKPQQFLDGGVTPYNNPALIAANFALLPEYGLKFAAGEEKLLVISVGTGRREMRYGTGEIQDMTVLSHAISVIGTLMDEVAVEQDTLCRVLGRCRFGAPIDRELGDLSRPDPSQPRRFSYVRYNHTYSAEEVAAACREHHCGWSLDALPLIPAIRAAGARYARQHVDLAHFAGFLEG